MIKIKITDDSFRYWPLIKQTPGAQGIWGNCQFFVNTDIEECDFWVVYGHIDRIETAICPRENTIFITTEPSTLLKYEPEFINQFGIVIAFRNDIDHKNIVNNQPGLPWHVGKIQLAKKEFQFNEHYSYDYLKAVTSFPKTKDISVICSNKTISEGHKKRFAFVAKLAEHFGPRLDVYGSGVNELADKWDAIAPYKYHLALENSVNPHYWTEKLADTYLAGAYPIYYGCPNVRDYFNPVTCIDIDNIDIAIETIERCLHNNVYENSLGEILTARNLVLDKYNLFNLLSEYSVAHDTKKPKTMVKLFPDRYCRNNLKSRLLKAFHSL